MKDNTTELKLYLKKALISTPNDFSLYEVKSYINKALNVIESVEKKRNIREQQKIERQEIKKSGKTDMYNVLHAIEQELNNEKQKLEEIKGRRNQPKLNNDNENGLDYVFG